MASTARTSATMLAFLAVAALCWDVMPLLHGGAFKLSTWGDIWYGLHPESLNVYKVGVEQYLSAALWDKVFAPLLTYTAVYLFAVPALGLFSLPFVLDIVNLIIEGGLGS